MKKIDEQNDDMDRIDDFDTFNEFDDDMDFDGIESDMTFDFEPEEDRDFDVDYNSDTDEDDDESNVTEQKDEHKSGRKKGFLLIIMGIIIGIFVIIILGFQLQEVRVIGNKNYTEDEVREMIGFSDKNRNTLFTVMKYSRFETKDIPFVNSIRVKMETPNIVCIEVEETNIIGCFKRGDTYYYFDDTGEIQEELKERQKQVPLIQGAETDYLKTGEVFSMKNRWTQSGILELAQMLKDQKISAKKIVISDDDKFTIYIDENIRVGIGLPLALDDKISEIANILPELRKMEETEEIQGILHLENYDSTKNSIVFTKEN